MTMCSKGFLPLMIPLSYLKRAFIWLHFPTPPASPQPAFLSLQHSFSTPSTNPAGTGFRTVRSWISDIVQRCAFTLYTPPLMHIDKGMKERVWFFHFPSPAILLASNFCSTL